MSSNYFARKGVQMFLNRAELAKELRISIPTIIKYEKEGMPRIINEEPFRYDLDDVIAWFKNRGKK